MRIKEFKLKIFTWLNEPKWLNRLALYFSLGAVIIVVSHIAFSYFSLLHTHVDSARYMLSALVQSEAAIVALVVTLSLVAVQLAAQSYSARVIEVFRRTPDLWILMGIYGIAIFYGLGVLKLIERANTQVNSLSNLEGHVAFAYYLGVFAFVALVPYIWNTLELLKPSTVIDMLSRRITKQNILAAIREGEEKSCENDPIQPIIDIIRGSLMKYDYETVRDGLRVIGDHTNHIFKNETFEKAEELRLSEHLFAHLTRVGKLAVSKEDEDSTLEVIINLQKNGEIAAERKLDEATQQVALSLGLIGKAAAQQKFGYVTQRTINSLGAVGTAAAKEKLEGATSIAAIYISEVGVVAAEQKFEEAMWAVSSLMSIEFVVAEKQLDETTKLVVFHLGVLGKAAAEQKLEGLTWYVADSLGKAGKALAEQKFKYIWQVVDSLKEVGMAAAEKELDEATKQAVYSLEVVGIATVEQELVEDSKRVRVYLDEILKISKEHKLKHATLQAEDSLKKINEALSKLGKK